MTITVALETSMPTSITVVATRTWISPARNRRMVSSRSSALSRPWTRPTSRSGHRAANDCAIVVAARRSARSDSSITGSTTYA